jgi:hypothetical protein
MLTSYVESRHPNMNKSTFFNNIITHRCLLLIATLFCPARLTCKK